MKPLKANAAVYRACGLNECSRRDEDFSSRCNKFLGACHRCEVLCNSLWNVDLLLLLVETWNDLCNITVVLAAEPRSYWLERKTISNQENRRALKTGTRWHIFLRNILVYCETAHQHTTSILFPGFNRIWNKFFIQNFINSGMLLSFYFGLWSIHNKGIQHGMWPRCCGLHCVHILAWLEQWASIFWWLSRSSVFLRAKTLLCEHQRMNFNMYTV